MVGLWRSSPLGYVVGHTATFAVNAALHGGESMAAPRVNRFLHPPITPGTRLNTSFHK